MLIEVEELSKDLFDIIEYYLDQPNKSIVILFHNSQCRNTFSQEYMKVAKIPDKVCPDYVKRGSSSLYTLLLENPDRIRGMRANPLLIYRRRSFSNQQDLDIVVQGFRVVTSNPIGRIKEAALQKRNSQ